MFVADEIQQAREELNSALSTLNELEEQYAALQRDYVDLKFQSDLASAVITQEELEESRGKKRPVTELKDKIRARLMRNRDYQSFIKLEAALKIMEKKYKVARTKIEALKLKYDFLRL